MRTVGISPKLRGPLSALTAAVAAVVTSYLDTGAVSEPALSAAAVALYTVARVYLASPGNVVPKEPVCP